MKRPEHIRKFIKENNGKCGVYRIFNPENGRSYIGSSVNIGNRIAIHFSQLMNGKHINKELQKDYHDRLVCELLVECNEIELLEKENKYINLTDNIYNNCEHITLKLPYIGSELINLFNSKIDKTQECWLWTGLNRNGYGRFYISPKYYPSHRIAYYLSTSIDPKHLLIRHKCNVKLCVNPEHLELGSFSDNAKDRVKSGLSNAKLDFEKVTQIRQLCLDNKELHFKDLQKLISKKLNINLENNTILHSILLNKTWKDNNWKPLKLNKLKGEECPWAKLNWDIVKDIRNLYNTTDISLSELSVYLVEKYNIFITFKTVHKIISNIRWYDQNYIYNKE